MHRFSINKLMIAVAVAGGLLGVYRSVNESAFVFLMGYGAVIAGLGWGIERGLRGERRKAARIMGVASILGVVALAALSVLWVGMLSLLTRVTALFAVLPVVGGSGLAWLRAATREGTEARRRPAPAWALVLGLVALPISMTFGDWPMRLAFVASRPALDRLVDRVRAGRRVDWPEWAGLFQVRAVSRWPTGPGHVSLILVGDSSGHTRFIRTPSPDEMPTITPPPHTLRKLGDSGVWWIHEIE